MTRGGSSWRVPLALVVLGLIPVISGSLRLIEAAGGPQLMPINPRIEASPAPLVVHVLAATIYALLGAFQFPARLRRRHPEWHRRSGRILVGAGLAVAGSGLWMTLFYSGAPGGVLLDHPAPGRLDDGRRHRVGVHRDPAPRHRRAPRLDDSGLRPRAGRRHPGVHRRDRLRPSSARGDLSKAISMGSAWVINALVAEWVIRHPSVRRAARGRARGAVLAASR